MRRRLPAGVRMYTGDDFNFAELIDGDGSGHSDALLGIFDAIAPAASARSPRSRADDRATLLRRSWRRPCRCRATSSRAPTRFYKTGVVFLAWLNGHQEHFVMVGGQQSARSLLHLAELFRLADAAGLLPIPVSPAAACATPRDARRARDDERAGKQGCSLTSHGALRPSDDRSRLRPIPALLSLNTATVREKWRLRAGRSRAARGTASAASRRGATSWRELGVQEAAKRIRDDGPARSRDCAAAACSPRPTARAGRRAHRRQPARDRRSGGARRALPGAGRRLAGLRRRGRSKDLAGAREMVRDGIGELLDHARVRRRAARDRAAAPDVLRPTAPASTRWRRRSTCATRWTRERAARSASRWTSTTCGGTRSSKQQIERAGAKRLLAFHICDWLVPTTDLLNDRGMMGDGVIDLPRIRSWMEAAGYRGFHEVEIFSARELVEARPGRGPGARCRHRQRSAADSACRSADERPCRPTAAAPVVASGGRDARRSVKSAVTTEPLPKESFMPLVSMRQLLDHAAENRYGLPAFNVNNLEQVQSDHGSAAAETDSPVIMQASAGARKYAGEIFLRHLIEAAVEELSADSRRHAPGPRPSRRRCANRAIGLGLSPA